MVNKTTNSARPVDKYLKRLVKVSKRLRKNVVENTPLELGDLSNLEVLLKETAHSMEREIDIERRQTELQLRLITEEVRKDEVDARANEAKAVERHRVASERGERFSDVFIRSKESIAQIECELNMLCPWHRTRVCKGVGVL